MVAIDHFAGRHGNLVAGPVGFGPGWWLVVLQAVQIVEPVLKAAHQVLPAVLQGLFLHFRIGQKIVRRRKHIEELPGCEFHDVFVLSGDAAYACCRVVPPLLIEKEGLVEQVVRPFLPGVPAEPPVLRQWLDTGSGFIAVDGARRRIACKPHPLSKRLLRQFELLSGRCCQMRQPVQIGTGECRGRQTHCKFAHPGFQRAIQKLRQIGIRKWLIASFLFRRIQRIRETKYFSARPGLGANLVGHIGGFGYCMAHRLAPSVWSAPV